MRAHGTCGVKYFFEFKDICCVRVPKTGSRNQCCVRHAAGVNKGEYSMLRRGGNDFTLGALMSASAAASAVGRASDVTASRVRDSLVPRVVSADSSRAGSCCKRRSLDTAASSLSYDGFSVGRCSYRGVL